MTAAEIMSPCSDFKNPLYTHDYTQYADDPLCYMFFVYEPDKCAHWPANFRHPKAGQIWLVQYTKEETEQFVELCKNFIATDPDRAQQTLMAMAKAMQLGV